MKNLTGKINDLISHILLTPYYWYVNIKEIPQFVGKLKVHKPTNKEFLQQYRNWLIKKSREGNVAQKKLNKKEWLPSFTILCLIEDPQSQNWQKTSEAISKIDYPKFEVILSSKKNLETALQNTKLILSTETSDVQRFNELAHHTENDFVLFIKEGDILESHIFTLISKEIVDYPSVDVLYFDEGKINNSGTKLSPNFKPQWSPDLLLNKNYIGNGFVLRTSVFESSNGFDISYKSSFKYDFILRATEHRTKISHISGVLLHTHTLNQYKNQLAEEKRAIEGSIKRRQIDVNLTVQDTRKRSFQTTYVCKSQPKVSIIIPSRDQASILEICLSSIESQTSYKDYEIIIIDNGSTEASFFTCLDRWQDKLKDRFIVKPLSIPFNFSKLNNEAVKIANGEYLLFLNNDVEIISPDWITTMVGQAQNKSTGAIGVKLLFPNNKIQHAGIFLGVGGVASHPFSKEPSVHDHSYVNTSVNYSALTGACLMVKKDLFFEVGGFDEGYVVEFNDLDLCLKIKQKGYHNIYLPQVELYHYESYSRGRKHKKLSSFLRYRQERQRFVNQWGDYVENDPSYNKYLNRDLDQLFEPNLD